MTCTICGGKLAFWLRMPIDAKKNALTTHSEVFICEDCQTGVITPLPFRHEVASFYDLDKYYTQGESHISAVAESFFDRILTKLAWWGDRASPFVVSDMASRLPDKACMVDLGCGDGMLLRAFADQGVDAIGIDPDPVAQKMAAERGVKVHLGTAENLPDEILGRDFDLVTMTHSLEHVVDPALALENAYGLLKNGGYAYIEVPNAACVHFVTLNKCSENFDSPRHLWFFSPDGLVKSLENAGFVVCDFRYHGFTRHHSRSWREWERKIFAQLKCRGMENGSKDHTFLRSISILFRSYFLSFGKKYDCIGVVARKYHAVAVMSVGTIMEDLMVPFYVLRNCLIPC